MMRWLLIILLSCLILFYSSIAACKFGPSKTEMYALEHNLQEQYVVILSQLELDENAKSFIDQLSSLPPGVQKSERIINCLKKIATDSKVSENELVRMDIATIISKLNEGQSASDQYVSYTDGIPYVLSNNNPNLSKAYTYLQSTSDKAVRRMSSFGIDDNVTDYIQFISSLPDRDFGLYALENGLCIEDRILTDIEKKFLQSPKQNIAQMLDYYLSIIQVIDQELAARIGQLPYMKDKAPELKNVEALEDILYLALDKKNKSNLEMVYGKGIERKMWPVALERIFYKGFDNEFNEISPFDGTEWYVNSKLAELQEKYNTEMDVDGFSGPRPAIRGVSYAWESFGYLIKRNPADNKLDQAVIRWVLRCNAERIWGFSDVAFDHVKLAQDEGIDVWLQFFPLYSFPDISFDEYRSQLLNFAGKAQEHKVNKLFVGNEIDLWWKKMGGCPAHNCDGYKARTTGVLGEYINSIVGDVRKIFKGQLTYAEWGALWNMFGAIDWSKMDVVSANIYIQEGASEEKFINAIINVRNSYSNPVVVSETGSQTFTEAEQAGGDYTYVFRDVHYDPEMQAKVINKELRNIYNAGVDGVFIYEWDSDVSHSAGNMNKLGFGIWDYVSKQPKPAFWAVYKYYKE